jgi:hypothetical protein
MRKAVSIFMMTFGSFIADAQSRMITEVFRLLPADKVYGLTLGTRDSMLQGKTYYPADNDSNEIQAYNYGISPEVNDYMYVSMSFETAQRASGMIEIRSFKKLNGDNLVMVSKTGGVWRVAYNQHDLSVFTYTRSKKLIPSNKKILPGTDESIFMKAGIPGSVKKMIVANSNLTFDLNREKLTVSLNSESLSNNPIARKWMKGDFIYFDWEKDHFVISEIVFQFPPKEE